MVNIDWSRSFFNGFLRSVARCTRCTRCKWTDNSLISSQLKVAWQDNKILKVSADPFKITTGTRAIWGPTGAMLAMIIHDPYVATCC